MTYEKWIESLGSDDKKTHFYNLKNIYETALTVFNMIDEELDLYDKALEHIQDCYG